MADRVKIIALAKDIVQNKVSSKFSDAAANSECLVDELIALNGGSEINIKKFHRGSELFDIVEEIIPIVADEGLQENDFFQDLVEYRNIALGDDIDFYTEDKAVLLVSDASYGVTGIRKQRLGEKKKYNIETTFKVVKVYEELKRLLAKRTDFETFITAVGTAVANKILDDTYVAFKNISATSYGLDPAYVITGSPDEDDILDLIAHIEASTGKTAYMVGTKKALRNVPSAVVSDEAKSDMYNIGHYGKFNGTDMIHIKQRHAAGTQTFILDDSKVYILAGDEKPIKVVNKGDGILSTSDPLQSPDQTQTYMYGQEFGVGVIFNEQIGICSF